MEQPNFEDYGDMNMFKEESLGPDGMKDLEDFTQGQFLAMSD